DENREHLRDWLPWLDRVTTLEDTRAFIAAALEQARAQKGFQTVIRADGELVGLVGQRSPEASGRSMTLGYWLAERAQGRGIMTRACAVHVEHGFTELPLAHAEIRCATGNVRSRAIPERLGFRPAGLIRDAEWLYDHYVDHVVYRLSAAEWRGLDAFLSSAAPSAAAPRE